MKALFPGIILFLIVALQACSNRSVYENIQVHQRSECQKHATQSEYKACMEKVNPSFDDYERERSRLLEEDED